MRKVTKGNVTIKLWDLGGQPRFRSMWERYCRAVSAIVYVTDFLFYLLCNSVKKLLFLAKYLLQSLHFLPLSLICGEVY